MESKQKVADDIKACIEQLNDKISQARENGLTVYVSQDFFVGKSKNVRVTIKEEITF